MGSSVCATLFLLQNYGDDKVKPKDEGIPEVYGNEKKGRQKVSKGMNPLIYPQYASEVLFLLFRKALISG
ncbi:hypothetical protein [Catalinimonas niigatensis]|uniref:hypothetical protein n=1 Tax=Catalinimonas niigatensis TaxID=1397264 RepID=UPI0026660D33|nr:hypothetical protein [Catalinimonas niigatensis]WPP50411.1 hypothetical protein PZB72_27470 [Catalinimonas niigatensis]